ncbi:carboxymuconolactone decarboxylase family protein [Streptomonospora nanhaiensis]|uniref:AhpD family alkylhydroperoxidase n=1 Tax=Streptomonospora nanhaiensis TaxID=1323731 RepID=A0A853BUX4_9ACTN|nr:carboxymuconolactone decarboxylase family protein [Streptomonospora nanhaiensis]MBV2364850.1 carboxymuconolactone decarboxylase family protein [Streptomonospora nanhaiensis]MBX9387182.1 carboxymuconolactone decarboxylase family protein [Streptomonospora nanhaiensis]NYI98794.1 AhpD family alkylhydroperoxidase [Streptomonospora nanhaiensis]
MTTTPASAAPETERTAHQSRLRNPAKLVPELGKVAGALFQATGNGSIPKTTIGLVQLRAGQLADSTYLTVLHTGNLRAAGETEERISAVASWRDAPHFTGAERVALELVEAVLTPNPHGERVPDELYARAAAHYDETALATLIMAIGQVCFFLPLALIGKPLPGVSPAEQWRD